MKISAACAVAGTAVVFMAAPASAGTSGRITHVSADTNGRVTLTLTAPGLPSGAGLDASEVRLLVDGQRVPARAHASELRRLPSASTSAMLVVDTSGSMSGRGIVAARNAAREFLAAAPADIKVGLAAFADQPHVLVRPTLDRRRTVAALPGLRPRGETALYDALVASTAAAGPGRQRLVVISDGADTVSRTGLTKAIRVLVHRDVAVEVVGLHTAEADNAVLRRIAEATGGRFVVAGNGAALASALRSSARSYATAVTVQATVPTDLWGASRRLTLEVASSAGPVRAGTTATIGSVALALTPAIRHGSSSQLLWEGLLAIAAALFLGVAALLGGDAGGRRRTRRLVNRYSLAPQSVAKNEASSVTKKALEVADRVAQSRGLNERLGTRLVRAGLTFTPSEWLLLQGGIAFAVLLVFVLLGMAPIVAVLAGAVVGPLLGHLFLGIRFSRRQAAFVAALPDTLQLIAGSLSAGYSLAQSLDGVVKQGEQPISGELGRALAESRLGVPIDRTLEHVAERMDSEDFRWVVLAIQIQHKVGGNLAEVLLTVAQTMRERVQLHRHVRALSAEGRLSAYILVGLPVFFTLYLATTRGAYLRPLYTTNLGLTMITTGLILLGLGSFVMKKMVKVEV